MEVVIDQVSCVVNIVALPVFAVCALIVVCKIKMDRSALLIILGYAGSLIMRFIIWVLYIVGRKDDSKVLSLIDLVACILIWTVLYYFIFEMRVVWDKVASNNPNEYYKRELITKKRRLIVLITANLFMWSIFLFNALTDGDMS